MSTPVEGQARRKHSELGVASFVVLLVSCALFLAAPVILVMHRNVFAELPLLPLAINFLVGMLPIAAVFLNLIGVGLGIAGAAQRNRRKVFAVLGIVLNGSAILLFAGLALVSTLLMTCRQL